MKEARYKAYQYCMIPFIYKIPRKAQVQDKADHFQDLVNEHKGILQSDQNVQPGLWQ